MPCTDVPGHVSKLVMPGLVPGIHDFLLAAKQDVDGRDKPGHDGLKAPLPCHESTTGYSTRDAKYSRATPVAAAPIAT